MTTMIKMNQVISTTVARPTGFASANIKWVIPVEPPAAPLPDVFASAEMTLMDGTKIKVVETVDDVVAAVNA